MMNVSNLKIEKGIPVPPREPHTGGLSSFLARLEVGDSFTIHKKSSTLWGALGSSRKKTKFRFATRKQEDGSIRVWRIE